MKKLFICCAMLMAVLSMLLCSCGKAAEVDIRALASEALFSGNLASLTVQYLSAEDLADEGLLADEFRTQLYDLCDLQDNGQLDGSVDRDNFPAVNVTRFQIASNNNAEGQDGDSGQGSEGGDGDSANPASNPKKHRGMLGNIPVEVIEDEDGKLHLSLVHGLDVSGDVDYKDLASQLVGSVFDSVFKPPVKPEDETTGDVPTEPPETSEETTEEDTHTTEEITFPPTKTDPPTPPSNPTAPDTSAATNAPTQPSTSKPATTEKITTTAKPNTTAEQNALPRVAEMKVGDIITIPGDRITTPAAFEKGKTWEQKMRAEAFFPLDVDGNGTTDYIIGKGASPSSGDYKNSVTGVALKPIGNGQYKVVKAPVTQKVVDGYAFIGIIPAGYSKSKFGMDAHGNPVYFADDAYELSFAKENSTAYICYKTDVCLGMDSASYIYL